jgi:hypothetical protein
LKNGDQPIDVSDETTNENDESSEEESSGEVDPQTANIPFLKETSEERLVRLDISRLIMQKKK